MMAGLNIYAIFLAALASTLVGFSWYAIFMQKDSVVKKEEILTKKMAEKPKKVFFTSFLANIFSAFALAILLTIFQTKNLAVGLQIALAVWFLLAGLSGIKKVLIDKKSLANFFLGAGHDFVSVLVSVYILLAMPK